MSTHWKPSEVALLIYARRKHVPVAKIAVYLNTTELSAKKVLFSYLHYRLSRQFMLSVSKCLVGISCLPTALKPFIPAPSKPRTETYFDRYM